MPYTWVLQKDDIGAPYILGFSKYKYHVLQKSQFSKCQWSGSCQNWLFFAYVSWIKFLKKVGNNNTTVLPTFSPDIKVSIGQRKPVSFDNFLITDILGKGLFLKVNDIVSIFWRIQCIRIFLREAPMLSLSRTQILPVARTNCWN